MCVLCETGGMVQRIIKAQWSVDYIIAINLI